ncbi:cytoskeletal protein binding protein [Tulasnella sp. 417]|nr:cytoskeletal protein binding protein [Tulasnella sp. 417]
MNKTNAATSQSISAALLDIMVAQWDFKARVNDELTISEGDRLFVLPGGGEEWAHVRHVTGAQADTSKSPSGLVPLKYLGKLEPLSRGSALYQYEPENENCVRMKLGQKLDVYMTMGKWMLVKLDVFRGKAGGLGYVPGNYVDVFDGRGDEVLQPSTFKEPPREVWNPSQPCQQNIYSTHSSIAISANNLSETSAIFNAHNVAFRMAIHFTS